MLILADIHGNWPALEAVLAAEPEHDTVVFCGDVVDYGPQPVECLRWLAKNADQVVRGNHDNALAFDVDCGCMRTFRTYSFATRAWHRTLLDDAEVNFLRSMPLRNQFEWQGRVFRMAHATPQGHLSEYLEPDEWASRVTGIDADYVLLGHTHIQGMASFGKITVVNPGSVGLARDHRGKACYAVCHDGQMELRQVSYDAGRTAALLRAAPLPIQVVDGLVGVLGCDE
ncbi:MAG: metallophosphoesterase family protein [Thermoguttaceae bacterium]|jgi:putative phosphoesterase